MITLRKRVESAKHGCSISTMNNSVSVVVSTYNGAAFIAEALQSVFRQTHKPDEIIVVDDGSVDETPAVVTAIARGAPIPIKFTRLSSNSGGPSRPLNTGISLARGHIIALLDHDDLMRPRRIEVQLKSISQSPECSMAISRFSIIGNAEGDMKPIWPTPQFSDLKDVLDLDAEFSILDSKAAFLALMNKNFAGSSSNFCFAKESWKRIGGFDDRIRTCVDLDFILKAVFNGPILVINETLFAYRWRSESLNRADTSKTDLELAVVRWRAACARPEWAGERRRALEDDFIHVAKLALRREDLAGVALVLKTFLHSGGLTTARTFLGRIRRGGKHLKGELR